MSPRHITTSPLRASLLITVVAAIGLLIYEATKSMLLPQLTLWESHSVTIAFGSVVAGIAGFSALRAQARLHAALLVEATERMQVEAESGALRASETRYRQLVEQSPEATVVHRMGRLLYANPACLRLVGARSLDELRGAALTTWIHADDRARFLGRMQALQDDAAAYPATTMYRLMARGGAVHDVEVVSVRITHDGQDAVQTIMRDVTEKNALERQLYHQAFHDALTGLANRSLFQDRVEQAFQRQRRSGARGDTLVVLFLDLDHFKTVNDSLGHAAGDELLRAVAARLLAVTRGCDSVARLGGDEFAVLLEGVASDAPTHVAERIVESMRDPFAVDGTTVSVGVSVGIASAQDASATDSLLRNADLALYAAKAQGRARHVTYHPTMHTVAVERMRLEGAIRPAIERLTPGQPDPDAAWHVLYQPVVDLDSQEITGVEALLRWTHPDGTAVPPSVFIPAAEDTGLIVPLGRWVLHEACRQAVAWEALGANGCITMGVNVSRRQFQEPDFVADVQDALATTGLDPARLTLEITEGLMMDDATATLGRLKALKDLGIRLAVDDFGTGYSSLAYLRQFPIDILKIDKSFITGMADGEHSVIANAIVSLGTALSLTTVAEGIEDADQRARLQALGCDRGQGYYFARPLPAHEVEERLAAPRAGRMAVTGVT